MCIQQRPVPHWPGKPGAFIALGASILVLLLRWLASRRDFRRSGHKHLTTRQLVQGVWLVCDVLPPNDYMTYCIRLTFVAIDDHSPGTSSCQDA